MNTAQLRCEVTPGQFSDEYCVVIELRGGVLTDLYAAREAVEVDREPTADRPAEGWLRVEVEWENATHALVRLPAEILGCGGWHLGVPRGQLRFPPVVQAPIPADRGEKWGRVATSTSQADAWRSALGLDNPTPPITCLRCGRLCIEWDAAAGVYRPCGHDCLYSNEGIGSAYRLGVEPARFSDWDPGEGDG